MAGTLDTVNGGLSTVRVSAIESLPRIAWAAGLDVSVPLDIAAALAGDGKPQATSIASRLPEAGGAVDAVRLRAAFTPFPPTSSRLPFSYQSVPLPVRTLIGHALGRLQRRQVASWAAFPRWPLDLSADFVADLCGADPSPFADGPTPVLLSHDIDTGEGLQNLVPRFLPIEESVGARSSNYIVPCSWPIDHALLAETSKRGHEIGIHGYDHSNRTPFADAAELRERIEAARPLVERYGITGYRAPSLLRTHALLQNLEGLYRYDSSIPTSGGLFPVPNNGCATARPFPLGKLIEIPLTMPRDGSLRFLGHSPDEILSIWKQCAHMIAASGGVVSLLTHCEDRFTGNQPMLSTYRQFLEYVAADRNYAFATPAQILERLTVDIS
jgi:peptidoglycan/xylan/chitin deacetylase (PgdA/CDA1 family)